MQRIGAVEPLDVPYFQTSFLTFIRKRAGWLIVLFIEEFFTQTALRHYDPVMEAVKGALLYVPLLISAGGNSGSQSSTLVIRGLALGEIKLARLVAHPHPRVGHGRRPRLHHRRHRHGPRDDVPRADVPLRAHRGHHRPLHHLAGCTVGSMLPIILKRLGIDPATSSTPFIASLVDTLGVIIYAHVAMIVMHDVIERHARRKGARLSA